MNASVLQIERDDVFGRLSPAPRLEMYARTLRPGWSAWGNEAPKEFTLEAA